MKLAPKLCRNDRSPPSPDRRPNRRPHWEGQVLVPRTWHRRQDHDQHSAAGTPGFEPRKPGWRGPERPEVDPVLPGVGVGVAEEEEGGVRFRRSATDERLHRISLHLKGQSRSWLFSFHSHTPHLYYVRFTDSAARIIIIYLTIHGYTELCYSSLLYPFLFSYHLMPKRKKQASRAIVVQGLWHNFNLASLAQMVVWESTEQ